MRGAYSLMAGHVQVLFLQCRYRRLQQIPQELDKGKKKKKREKQVREHPSCRKNLDDGPGLCSSGRMDHVISVHWTVVQASAGSQSISFNDTLTKSIWLNRTQSSSNKRPSTWADRNILGNSSVQVGKTSCSRMMLHRSVILDLLRSPELHTKARYI